MQIQTNAFVEDLKDGEFVAVNAAGTPIGRAGSKEALEQAHASDDVQILSAADVKAAEPSLAEAAAARLDGPFAAIVAQGVLDPDGNPPLDKAPPPAVDGSAFDHDNDGKVGGSKPKAAAKKAAVKK